MTSAPGARSPDTILIAREPGETWFALLAGDEVIEVAIARDGEIEPGAVYAGRAAKRLGSTACFVDLGTGLPGFLQARSGLPAEGRLVKVTVIAAATSDKGPTLALAMPAEEIEGVPRQLSPALTPAQEWASHYGAAIERVVGTGPEIGRYAGGTLDALKRSRDDLFEERGVNEALDAALTATVPLPGGGSVIFERTAAAVVIDINAGATDLDAANREAMLVIARHLRLRNLSGHILVDLIPTKKRALHRETLAAMVSADPVRTQVTGFTPLGMLELTRQRKRASLGEYWNDAARATAYRALRLAVRAAARSPDVTLSLSTAPAALLSSALASTLKEAEAASGCKIRVTQNAAFAPDRIEVS